MGKKEVAVEAREFLKFDSLTLLKNLTGYINVLFEDGKVFRMHSKDIIISRYFWELIKVNPELKFVSKYRVSNYYTNNMYTGKTHTKLLSTLMADLINTVYKVNGKDVYGQLGVMYKDMYAIMEKLYSEFSYNITDYVISMNIKDLLDIQLDKRLMEAMADVSKEMTVDSIDIAHGVMDDIIRNRVDLKNNPVVKAYISGMINANQMKQVLGPRGYVTELDSSIFKYPISSSFTMGMKNMYEVATDSRSGAKALFLSNKAIQDSEYFGRELHLATMTVEDLVHTDCGSTDYLDWYVKPKEVSGTTVIYKGDLSNLEGKWYLNEETNKLEVITKDMVHLYGKTIKLRSAIKCKLANKKQICTKCFGELAYAIPRHSNLGHLCSTEINAKISQSILSTKHLVTSATAGAVTLCDDAKKFFTIKDKNGYTLKLPVLTKKGVKVSLIFKQEECFGLKDIKLDKSINVINPGRVSRIESMTIKYEYKDKVTYYNIKVGIGNRYGVLELKFLNYIIENGYEADENDNYIVDVTKWKFITPIIKLPEVEFSFLALSKDTKDMFKTMSILKGGISKDSPESLLSKVFTLVNSKLDINIALFEVVVYAFTVYDLPNGNYDLGRNSPNPQLSPLLTVIDKRSAGASYGYDDLSGKILMPDLFTNVNKPDHILDVLLKPNEVITATK